MRLATFVVLTVTVPPICGCSVTPTSANHPASEPQVSYRGGDGSTFEAAIVVVAPNEAVGISAEYTLLRHKYEISERPSQALIRKNGKSYDVMNVVDTSGGKHTVIFDVTAFYGKH